MSETTVVSATTPVKVRLIEQVCDRFEAAWRGGERPNLEAYLGQCEASLHSVLLRHLLPLEWEYRLQAGEQPRAKEYEARFPAAGELIEAIEREVENPATGQPQRMGAYRIVRQVGRGGMGVVFEAIHESQGRRVALKVLPGFDLADPTARERFWREAHTTARLQHPNIVQIFEVGEHESQPFLALEFVAGQSLSQRLREAPLMPRQAAALVETLARAVHHAHEQGIVHRDLKPANVLLSSVTGHSSFVNAEEQMTNDQGQMTIPKLTDFGLAHHVGARELTATGDILGTPGYMAPEQAWGKNKSRQVGPAADVYALGALLYAALTGRPPFQGATPLDTLEQVRSQEPVPPTRLQPRVPRDLETICLKCLEKEPGQRYTSAAALANDLRRYLANQPVTARRPSQVLRLRRWCGRNPAPTLALVLGVVALVSAAGLAVSQAFTTKLREEQKITQAALQDAKFQRSRAELNAEQLASQQELTKAALVQAEQFRQQAEGMSASLALERGLTLLEQGDVARGMLALGHSLRIAPPAATDLNHVIRSNLAAAQSKLPFHLDAILEHGGEVQAVAFSPDGKTLLTGGRASPPRRWDALSGALVGEPLPHPGDIRAVAFSSDGAMLATASTDKTARLWNAATGTPIGKPLTHEHWVLCVAISPDGKTAVTGSADGTARLWDVVTGELRGELRPPGWVYAVAYSPDGSTLATGSGNTSQLWQAGTLMPLCEPMRHPSEVWAVAFSPDSRVLVTGSEEGTARFWEASSGKPLGLPLLHQGAVRAVGYSPDGKTLWTGGASGKVRLWDTKSMTPRGLPVHHQSAVYAVSFSPNQRRLATGSADGKVRLWQKAEATSAGLVLPHERLVYCVAFSPDGKTIATGSADPNVRLWDAATGELVGKPLTHPASILRVAFSPAGQTLVTGCSDKTARLWNVADGTQCGPALEHADHVYDVTFSPDGQTVVTASKDSTARLWDASTGKPRCDALQHPRWVHAVAVSPDGQTILTGCEDGTARLWDAATGAPLGEPLQHRGPVRAVAFSPDGKMMLTGTWDDGTARLWDSATRKPIGSPLLHQDHVLTVAFSPDGKTIATGTWDGAARLWDVATGKPLGLPMLHQRTVRAVTFSPGGKNLWTGSFERTARSWEMPADVPGEVDQVNLWIQVLTGMELDSDGLFRALDAPAWNERRRELDQTGPPALVQMSSGAL
jgi:eukaryotic-like serine/threonine-protein kinase